MRLLYVCSDFGIAPDGTKGASIHLRAITRALAELGHEVLLLSPKDGPGDDHPARRLLPAGCKPATETGRMLKRWLVDRDLDDGIARELRPLLFNAWVGDRAVDALASRPPDAIIERLSLFGHVGLDLADALDVPLIIEQNAPLTREASTFRSLNLRRLAGEIEHRVLDRADDVITVSSQLARQLTDNGIDPSKIHVIPNGVDLRRFDKGPSREACRASLGLTDNFVIGFAGSLKLWHGVDLLLEAFGRIAQRDASARLLIVGSGPAEADLHKIAADVGLGQKVIFTGAVEHQRVPELLRAMDVTAAPFRFVEDFYFSPIKLFEYMAAGVCVVASRLGQIADVIEDGVNGLLCVPDDADALASRIEQVRNAPDVRRLMAERASRTVRERYTWSHAGHTTSDVVGRAIQRRRDRSKQNLANVLAMSS